MGVVDFWAVKILLYVWKDGDRGMEGDELKKMALYTAVYQPESKQTKIFLVF